MARAPARRPRSAGGHPEQRDDQPGLHLIGDQHPVSGPVRGARGTIPASWPDQHGYLGTPQDPSTGLSLLGTRQYDPATGRFLSVDPILQVGDNRQTNGYSYAADDPVDSSDPAGLDDWYNDPTQNVTQYDGGNVGDQWWFDPNQDPVDRTGHQCDDWYFDPKENAPVTKHPKSPATAPGQAKASVPAQTPTMSPRTGVSVGLRRHRPVSRWDRDSDPGR